MKNKKLSYHWLIVAAVFIMFASSVAIVVNCFSVFGPAIMKETGFSVSEIQLVNTMTVVANIIGCVFIGKVIAKMGLRVSLPLYTVIMCGGLLMRSFCHSFPSFLIWGFIMGIGLSGTSTIPGSMLINNWFTAKKGTATGIAFSGSVVGGLIFVQLSRYLVDSIGWRSANIYLAAISAILLLPTAIFIVREKPSDKGLKPLGAEELADGAEDVLKGISMKKFFKTPAFWLLAFASFGIGFCNLGMQNNVTICLETEMGHSAAFAANVFTIVMAVQILGKIVLGAVYDKKGIAFGSIYNLVLMIASVVCMMLSGNVAIAIVYGVLFGFTGSMTTVTPPYITAFAVGRKNYSSIYGILSVFFGLGCAVGPLLAAKIFDSTGSFNVAWIIFAVFAALVALSTILCAKKSQGYAEMDD